MQGLYRHTMLLLGIACVAAGCRRGELPIKPHEMGDVTSASADMDPPVPYLVTGCVLNRYATAAYEDTANTFESTTLATVNPGMLRYDITAIGYDWKLFNGTKYTVRPNNYIIRDSKGLIYKLHFTGFYNAAGVKGNPQWEYQQL